MFGTFIFSPYLCADETSEQYIFHPIEKKIKIFEKKVVNCL